MADAHKHKYDPIEHVLDHDTLEIPGSWSEQQIQLHPIDLGFYRFQPTRFMVMELIVAVLLIVIMIPLARHIAKRPVTRGPFMNAFEAFLLFLRDVVARPAIGGHGADHFLPYLWTVFFFVLFSNLMGMIPGGASATGNINVTAVLALMTFGVVLIAGMKAMGPAGFWIGIVPKLDVPVALKYPLWGLMFVIEVAGLFIRHIVLSVRLFANMLAGHIVLAVVLGFIIQASGTLYWYMVTPASLAGVIALSLLELFVAFLQAYIFTFLSALFIGTAVHPH